jgi:uncharacterized protein
MPNFRPQLKTYIRREAYPRHKYSHQPRLYALTQQIAAAVTPAPEQLRQWDHVVYTCQRAPDILRDLGFSERKIPAVLNCIREHQPHDTTRSIEATLLRDADILEQIGAIGILRTAAKLGSDTRFRTFADARDSLQRAIDTLPSQIALEATRTLAAPRIAALRSFLDALNSEAGIDLD